MEKKQELFEKWMSVNTLMKAVRHKARHDNGPMGDTTRGRGRVLALLKLHDGVSTRDMAEILGIRVSSLNETLAKLEAEGYVSRTPSEDDRRVMLVGLTQKGRDEKQPRHRMPELLFGRLDASEQEVLDGYLDRMVAAFEDELGEDAATVAERARKRRREFFDRADGHGAGGGGGAAGPRGGQHRHHHHRLPENRRGDERQR